MNTLQQLTELIHKKFDIETSVLQPDLPMEEYGMDSLSLAELLFTIEEDFDIEFPERPENIDTLTGLAALIDQLRARRPA
jgi:acyl carrier protein